MSRLPAMVRSMGLLMESILEDGEDPMVIGSDYINVLCQVTSTSGALSFETGEWYLLLVYISEVQLQFSSGVGTNEGKAEREKWLQWAHADAGGSQF